MLGSTSQKGQTIRFLSSGDLDLGGTVAGWQMVDGGKLKYTDGGYSFLFTLTFIGSNTSSSQQLKLTGNVNGEDWAISLQH